MSNTPPRAVAHQDSIIRALVKLFEMSVEDLEALQRGGSRAVEKLIRSYHYWSVEYNSGICPYDHPKLGYFRMTPSAAEHDGSAKGLHCEHVVPIRWLAQTMQDKRRTTEQPLTEEFVRCLMEINEIVVVTKEQAKQLDKFYRSRMPESWSMSGSILARLEACLPPQELALVGERLIGVTPSGA